MPCICSDNISISLGFFLQLHVITYNNLQKQKELLLRISEGEIKLSLQKENKHTRSMKTREQFRIIHKLMELSLELAGI